MPASTYPRYALFGEERYTFERAIPHVGSDGTSVVECLSGSNDIYFATENEWFEGVKRFDCWAANAAIVTSDSKAAQKLDLFRSLFKGRQDVYAHGYRRKDGGIAYTPACANEWKPGICPKGTSVKTRCADCGQRVFLPLGDQAIIRHFKGTSETFKDVIALYVLEPDGNTTSLLVADFDGEGWKEAVTAYRNTARAFGIDVAVERSRSGAGGHAWIFFVTPVSARLARNLGSAIITKAMQSCDALRFDAYDRMFPAQDTVIQGGFGNAIALPFQGRAQHLGNSVFVDDTLEAYPDQWLFLSQIARATEQQARRLIEACGSNVLGELAETKPAPKSGDSPRKSHDTRKLTQDDFFSPLEIVQADMLYIPTDSLSHAATDVIRRIAAFGNPEFYRAQAMHRPVYNKPRIIYLGETRENCIALPRGCKQRLVETLQDAGTRYSIQDERFSGPALDIDFAGTLRDEQQRAADLLLKHDDGILSAPTGFGKTVVGAYLISQVKLPTLVIVPKTALVEQWVDKLNDFLEIKVEAAPLLTPSGRPSKRKRPTIGRIGGGKNKPSGIVDVATYQSLVEKSTDGLDGVKSLVRNYGLVLCDECHHAAAPQLERILKAATARRVYGLSATPKRSDGLDSALYMLCGPIRCKISPKEQATRQGFERVLIPRFTKIRFPNLEAGVSFNQVVDKLCAHEARNEMIVGDVVHALDEGKMPLVVTKRKVHAQLLFDAITSTGKSARLLVGEGTPRQKRDRLNEAAQESERSLFAIVATESYLGEGFDMPRLDTLFLATPISWDGNVTQQSGRLHREYEGKAAVYVYDYVDNSIPMLERMYKRRLKTYAALGYTAALDSSAETAHTASFVDAEAFRKEFERDIEAATHSIELFAPYASLSFASSICSIFEYTISRGIRIVCTICAASPESRPQEPLPDQLKKAVSRLRNSGCEVIFDEMAVAGLAVFDEKTVWYGNLPLLAFPKAEDCSLRFESAEIAHDVPRRRTT